MVLGGLFCCCAGVLETFGLSYIGKMLLKAGLLGFGGGGSNTPFGTSSLLFSSRGGLSEKGPGAG